MGQEGVYYVLKNNFMKEIMHQLKWKTIVIGTNEWLGDSDNLVKRFLRFSD